MLIRHYHRPSIGNAPGVSRNYRGRRLSGLNGPAGANSCAEYIQNAFNALPPLSMFGPNPGPEVLAAAYINYPGMTPSQLAQSVTMQLAQEYCGAVNAEISSGDPNAASPADCTDGGATCAAAAVPQWEEYYNSIPSAIFSTSALAYTPPSPTPVPAPVPVAQPQTAPAVNTQGNVLNPPTPAPAIQPGSLVQNQTGSGAPVGAGAAPPSGGTNPLVGTGAGAGTSAGAGTTIPTWAIVAVAAVGVLLLMKGGER
jgi:hypothetical protein